MSLAYLHLLFACFRLCVGYCAALGRVFFVVVICLAQLWFYGWFACCGAV